jgi:hypothetical protein
LFRLLWRWLFLWLIEDDDHIFLSVKDLLCLLSQGICVLTLNEAFSVVFENNSSKHDHANGDRDSNQYDIDPVIRFKVAGEQVVLSHYYLNGGKAHVDRRVDGCREKESW